MTVDGTDFRIFEQKPFSKKWYSFKINGPGLRYELGVCIQSGDIVWINGPYKPGSWNDLKIFQHKLAHKLRPGEKVEADMGYRDLRYVRYPHVFVSRSDRRSKRRVRGRHETVNARLKQFSCLKKVWRHSVHKHKKAFIAVAVLTQLSFDNGEKLLSCNY